MNPREKFLSTIRGENFDLPIFCPAIYDYKVNFSNAPLNLFGLSENEFINAIEKEIYSLQSEVVTCGYDIYNIEAEALGSKVKRENKDIFPDIADPILNDLSKTACLPEFNDLKGRMPLMIGIAKQLNIKYQDKVYIRGAISGPFSLAGRIYSKEKLILECILNPRGVHHLLQYCTDVIITYLTGFLDEGQDVVVFDSLASPPLISPEIYRDLILPFHQRIFEFMKDREIPIRPLIMGGNTLSIMKYLAKTGANQLLLDYNIPLNDVKTILSQYKLGFRVNIDPALVMHNNKDHIASVMKQVLGFLSHSPNLLLGTGILMPYTPLENIQLVRDIIIKYYRMLLNK